MPCREIGHCRRETLQTKLPSTNDSCTRQPRRPYADLMLVSSLAQRPNQVWREVGSNAARADPASRPCTLAGLQLHVARAGRLAAPRFSHPRARTEGGPPPPAATNARNPVAGAKRASLA